jgi:transposase
MLYVGLDLSRKRLDYHVLSEEGGSVAVAAVPPGRDGLRGLVARLVGEPVGAAIESMNGARFVHDQLELGGWQVAIADAARVKGLAPLACKTDRIEARVLAELAWRDLLRCGCPIRRCAASGSGRACASTSSGTGAR